MSKKRRVIIITQNEPLYLFENIERLFNECDPKVSFVKVFILPSKEFGKNLSKKELYVKAVTTFGIFFAVNYFFRLCLRKISRKSNIVHLLRKNAVEYEIVSGNINSIENVSKIKATNADVCVSILGSQIFKKHLIEVLPIFMNLHSSLLPIHRGMLPSFWSMIRKDREVGVSLFQVDEGIDSGPIIMQKRVLNTFKTQAEFIRVTKNMGITAILEILENDEIVLSPQSEYNKGYNNMPERRDVQEFYRLGFKFF